MLHKLNDNFYFYYPTESQALRRMIDHTVIAFIVILTIKVQHCVSVDVIAQHENYEPDYSMYHNVSSIVKELKQMESKYNNYFKIDDAFVSTNGVTQLFMRLSNFSNTDEINLNRVKILMAFGEHAREFFPVESLLYFLKNVTLGIEYFMYKDHRKFQSYQYSSWLLSNFDLFIIALTNPDGRHYIEDTKNYCWRGTAKGIDLNRNFDWNYGKEGSSSDPKDDEYRGPYAFSGKQEFKKFFFNN